MTKIVWNGCDSYVEIDQAVARGYDCDGEVLYTPREAFTAFEAIEINPADLPVDEDGEPDFNGVIGTETGRFYRAV
jgi:hypothetical protein